LRASDPSILIVDDLQFMLHVAPPWHDPWAIGDLQVAAIGIAVTFLRTHPVRSQVFEYAFEPFPIVDIYGILLFLNVDSI